MRRVLIDAIAEHVAGDIAAMYGLEGAELQVKRIVIGIIDADPHAEYIIRRALSDIRDGIGVTEAPWNDENWFDPERNA